MAKRETAEGPEIDLNLAQPEAAQSRPEPQAELRIEDAGRAEELAARKARLGSAVMGYSGNLGRRILG